MGRTARIRAERKRHFSVRNAVKLNSDPIIINLISWLRMHGWTPSCILYPADFAMTGRGLMAGLNILENEVLVKIPLTALVTSKTVEESDLCEILAQKPLLSQEILAVFLVWEKRKGNNSEWSPYIHSLPNAYSTPVFVNFPNLPVFPELIKNSIQEAQSAFHRSLRRLKTLLPDLQEDELKWAWSCVNTRAVYLPGPFSKSTHNKLKIIDRDCLALAPFLDLFNHSNDVSVEVKVSHDNYELITKNSYKKYDQVFINYGPHANLKLFSEYGFAIPGNPHDILPISQNDLLQIANITNSTISKFAEEKLTLLKEHGLLDSLALNRRGVSWSTLAAIKLLKCNNQDKSKWRNIIYSDAVEEFDRTTLTSIANIAETYEHSFEKACEELKRTGTFLQSSAIRSCYFLMVELKNVASVSRQCLLSRD